jgi:hypothetical protein
MNAQPGVDESRFGRPALKMAGVAMLMMFLLWVRGSG